MEIKQPHDNNSEKGLLGTLLLDPDGACGKPSVQQINPSDFYTSLHKNIFKHLLNMYQSKYRLLTSLNDFLKKHNQLDKIKQH